MTNLKECVIKYNQTKMGSDKNVIPISHSILEIEPDKIGSYTNLFILNGITQLQMYLANAGNTMIATK